MRDGKHIVLKKSDADIEELDLSAFDAMVTVVPSILEPAAVDASIETIKQLGLFDRGNLVNQVSEGAVAYSQERAAEMVGMRRLADGTLVENPNAEWRIDITTRDEIQKIITDGLRDNIGRDEIADEIEASFWFSAQRAELIANTEITMANGQAKLSSMREARNAGVKLKKSWYPDADACPICLDNAAAGAIPIDDDFPSGDDAEPAHPKCECTVIPEVEEAAADDVESDEADAEAAVDQVGESNDNSMAEGGGG